jgi:hypothetical protein
MLPGPAFTVPTSYELKPELVSFGSLLAYAENSTCEFFAFAVTLAVAL